MENTSVQGKNPLIDFLQKFYAQILFAPILFGGISQVISLFSISPNAIRFFSTSQAISDGLFFLTVLLIFILASAVLVFFIFLWAAITAKPPEEKIEEEKTEEEEDDDDDDDSGDNFKRYKYSHEAMPKLAHIILLPLLLYCYYLIAFKYLPFGLKYANTLTLDFLTLAPFCFLFNFGISIILMRFIYFNSEYYFVEKRNTFYFLNIFLCLIVLMFFNISLTKNSNFISNFNKIKEKYCCDSPGTVDILYFNDKYIFIKKKCLKSEVLVAKFDDLFEEKQK